MKAEAQSELRGAVRFPVKLPISVTVEGEQHEAETFNMSAGGMLFHLESDMQIGSTIEFQVAMPAALLGSATDVMVTGSARVIRCDAEGKRRTVAAVIDEYKFERRQ